MTYEKPLNLKRQTKKEIYLVQKIPGPKISQAKKRLEVQNLGYQIKDLEVFFTKVY